MCGLVAVFSRSGRARVFDLARALDALAHRGPDGRGSRVSHDGRVALGHTRLAIVDLETGAQPLTNEDGRVHAVVNGEIYDDAAHRRDLMARGHVFRTRSDSEILVHLFEEHGKGAVSMVRGELAFALHDAGTDTFVAGRDRFGIKPLVYTLLEDGVAVASEAKALFALGAVAPRWDGGSVLHAARHQYLPPGRSLFAGVHELPPGHLLIVAGSRAPRLERYWDLDDAPPEISSAQDDDAPPASETFSDLLEDAVRERLRADVPMAFHLSGGIDSASVLALAARHHQGPLHAFTVRFSRAPWDETELAREIAAHVGATLHVVDANEDALVDTLPDAVFHGERLGINGQLPAKLLLARAVRDAGFSVVLSGEGADEQLLGYPHLLRDLARAASGEATDDEEVRRALCAEHPAQVGIMLPDRGTTSGQPSMPGVARALGFVPTFLEAKAAFGERILGLFDADAEAAVRARDPIEALLDGFDVAALARMHPADASSYLWTKLALAGYILRALGDGAEMAASVEGRPPFLDHHLFAYARALPVSARVLGGIPKQPLRAAMRWLLPERVVARRKHPFLAPPLTCFATPRGRALVNDVLRGSSLTRVPFVDTRRVASFLDELERSDDEARASADPVVYTLLSLALVADRFSPSSEGARP